MKTGRTRAESTGHDARRTDGRSRLFYRDCGVVLQPDQVPVVLHGGELPLLPFLEWRSRARIEPTVDFGVAVGKGQAARLVVEAPRKVDQHGGRPFRHVDRIVAVV